jgi:co-chaperonin GroES (HSP10)
MANQPPVSTRGVAVVKARNANVVVEILNPVASQGGIILPAKLREQVRTALVVSVGDGILSLNGERKPINLRKGDIVAMRPGRGVPFEADGRVYVVVDQAEIPVVFTTESGDVLTDPAAVDPLMVRRAGGAVPQEMGVEAGARETESADAIPENPADAEREDDDGSAVSED